MKLELLNADLTAGKYAEKFTAMYGAENVEAQVRENLWKLSGTKPAAKVSEHPIAVSADDFDDED